MGSEPAHDIHRRRRRAECPACGRDFLVASTPDPYVNVLVTPVHLDGPVPCCGSHRPLTRVEDAIPAQAAPATSTSGISATHRGDFGHPPRWFRPPTMVARDRSAEVAALEGGDAGDGEQDGAGQEGQQRAGADALGQDRGAVVDGEG